VFELHERDFGLRSDAAMDHVCNTLARALRWSCYFYTARNLFVKRWRASFGAASVAAGALGAFAAGAFTIGAFAAGVFVISKLKVATGRFERLEIDELIVRKLTIVEETPRAGG
jgi:hypothetical protein